MSLSRLRRLLTQAVERWCPDQAKELGRRLVEYVTKPWTEETDNRILYPVRSVGLMRLEQDLGVKIKASDLLVVVEAINKAGVKCWVTGQTFNLEVPEAFLPKEGQA